MGKVLIIKGADFSENSVGAGVSSESFKTLIENSFQPCYQLNRAMGSNGMEFVAPSESSSRACVYALDISRYSEAGFSDVEIKLKDNTEGFVFVGFGSLIGVENYGFDNNGTGTGQWAWLTGSLKGKIGEMKESYFQGNANTLWLHVRYKDNSVVSSNASIYEFVESISIY